MDFPRKILRSILRVLSKHALKKHEIELVVITGWYGTEIAKDMLYTILSEKLKVRRNIREVWWDFSIPLGILGYKDKKRNFLEWTRLVFKATFYILFGKSNPQTLILSADSHVDSVINYWSSILEPHYLVIINNKDHKKVVNNLINKVNKNGLIICNPSKLSKEVNVLLKDKNVYTFGEDKKSNIALNVDNEFVNIRSKDETIKLPKKKTPSFTQDILGGIFAFAEYKEFSLEDIAYGILKFETPGRVLKLIKSNLLKSEDRE